MKSIFFTPIYALTALVCIQKPIASMASFTIVNNAGHDVYLMLRFQKYASMPGKPIGIITPLKGKGSSGKLTKTGKKMLLKNNQSHLLTLPAFLQSIDKIEVTAFYTTNIGECCYNTMAYSVNGLPPVLTLSTQSANRRPSLASTMYLRRISDSYTACDILYQENIDKTAHTMPANMP